MLELKGKTVLVTGGAGFIGSHLCERLAQMGNRVISLDNYFAGLRDNHVLGVEYREGHTKDIEEHIPEAPDVVFHLGEYSRVEKSFEDIEDVWDLNIAGTFAVLEFCRRRKCKIIYAGSSTKFANDGDGRNQSPYAWSKAANTELVKQYGEWYGVRYAITYFYNVYGGRERGVGPYATLIGIFKNLYLGGKPLPVVAPGTQLRNFTHVEDTVDALILVGERGEGDEYGIGAEESFSVIDVAHMLGGNMLLLPERKGNRLSSPVHTEKIKNLGWVQRRRLDTHIADFIRDNKPLTKAVDLPRVLVFSTTYRPDSGNAEEALYDLMQSMPEVQFDIVTTTFSPRAKDYVNDLKNVRIYRVGVGRLFDKYLLPLSGYRVARNLARQNNYLFSWSLLASYGTFAAVLLRRSERIPVLLTTADQKVSGLSFWARMFVNTLLRDADQATALDVADEKHIKNLRSRTLKKHVLGTGDALMNATRFAYSNILRARLGR